MGGVSGINTRRAMAPFPLHPPALPLLILVKRFKELKTHLLHHGYDLAILFPVANQLYLIYPEWRHSHVTLKMKITNESVSLAVTYNSMLTACKQVPHTIRSTTTGQAASISYGRPIAIIMQDQECNPDSYLISV